MIFLGINQLKYVECAQDIIFIRHPPPASGCKVSLDNNFLFVSVVVLTTSLTYAYITSLDNKLCL
jgi:hypothetical protein